MKISFIHVIIFLCILITGTYILSIGNSPLLYSLELEKPSTLYHINIHAEELRIVNSSDDVNPLMQEILDYSGPIALNIRMQDINAASADLKQYSNKYRNFDKLVINLEMTESEISDFQNNTKLQEELFTELMNASESLNTLKRLEFRYRDQKDITSLKTVAFQGEALQKKIKTIRNKYNLVNTEIQNQSLKYNLNTSKIEQAKIDINKFVDDITDDQEIIKKEVAFTPYETPISKITLIITPERGTYKDIIHYSGFISGFNSKNKNYILFIDGNEYISSRTDDVGQYSIYKPIEKMKTGMHIVTAQSGSLLSESVQLYAYPVNSTIDLSIKAKSSEPIIILSGQLKTNAEVSYAPVHSIINNDTWNTTLTDIHGKYNSNITLPEGRYLVYSLFNDTSYPILSNQSQIYEVVSSGTHIISIRLLTEEDYSIWFILILIFFVIIGGFVGFYLISHRKNTKSWNENGPEDTFPSNIKQYQNESSYSNIQEISNNDLLSIFQICIQDHRLSESARHVYLIILNKIIHNTPIYHYKSLTIREIAGFVSMKPYGIAFQKFAGIYEKIRYGGSETSKDKKELEKRIDEIEIVFREKQ